MSRTAQPERRALPSLSELSRPQICGRACVWCGRPLANSNAVDLGEQRARRLDQFFTWFPRECGNGCPKEES